MFNMIIFACSLYRLLCFAEAPDPIWRFFVATNLLASKTPNLKYWIKPRKNSIKQNAYFKHSQSNIFILREIVDTIEFAAKMLEKVQFIIDTGNFESMLHTIQIVNDILKSGA